MSEYDEIIILDDDELDDELDYRNARTNRRDRRGFGRGSRGRGGRRSTGGRRVGVRRPSSRRPVPFRPENAGPVIRDDTGGLSTGVLVDAGAQVLAAIQPLPTPPVATGKAEVDLANLILYQQAIAEHAKRDEQLRTIGSLASKLFA
jgi:hypothetical protein